MRTSPDFYKQPGGLILAFSQNEVPYGKLILGYDYENQKWVTKGRKEVEEYFKKHKLTLTINKERN